MEKQVQVSKEMTELMSAVVELITVTKSALGNGFQLGEDIGPILAVAIAKLPLAVDGMDKLGDEFKSDHKAFMNAASLGAIEIVDLFLPKAEVQANPPVQA